MSTTSATLKQTEDVWKHFVRTGRIEPGLVKAEIKDSWIRCQKSGVDPNDGTCRHILPEAEVRALIASHRDFIDIARPFITGLYKFVQGSGFIVMLADKDGHILEAFGDTKMVYKLVEEVNFVPGALWTEEEVGTNAIGTALKLKKPFQTSASEHYCLKHHKWTCSAAPIFGGDGNLLGILDLSGPSSKSHAHTLGMVVASVRAIEEQMKAEEKNRLLNVANIHLSNVINTMSDGVIIADRTGFVTDINPVAEEIIGRSADDVIGNHIDKLITNKVVERLLNYNEPYSYLEVLVEAADGKSYCISSGNPMLDDKGRPDGAVFIIHHMQKVHKLVNRLNGAQATYHLDDVVGTSRAIKETIRLASATSSGVYNILLEGESGVGKEVFAQAIHNCGPRRNGPFIAVNCGAIPRELVASELFGYAEGAFTGARKGGRPGKFELASGGTLFLDEIGDMPLEEQVTLLRVLEDKRVIRIGSEKVIPVDVRIICATNKNLEEEVKKGSFRRDLYYRLNVVSIRIPPLRERREDIPLLFEYFKNKIAEEWKLPCRNVDDKVLQCLQQYDWPGNVRQLQNVVERIISISDDDGIRLEHLPAAIINCANGCTSTCNDEFDIIPSARDKRKKIKAEAEHGQIVSLLTKHGGNVSQVARDMGISRNTLYRKMHNYNIAN